jgi:glycosyltransferase domain-containing protein
MALGDLTFVIPTYNRPDRLMRLLTYLAQYRAGASVMVLDSSIEIPDQVALDAAIAAAGANYVRFDPSVAPYAKMRDGVARVDTQYVALWGDDDMLVPTGVLSATEALAANPKLSIAHGVSVIANLRQAGSRTEMVALDPYPQTEVHGDNAGARLWDHLVGYATTFYSVHRTQDLLHNLTLCVENGFGHFWGEYFLSAMSAIQGGIGQVDALYMVRECHESMDSVNKTGARIDFFDFISSKGYGSMYEKFRDALAAEIVARDGVSLETAAADVKRAWWGHLVIGVPKKYRSEYELAPSATASRVKRVIKTTTLLGALATRVQAARLRSDTKGDLSLGALLDPSSPYHADFAPVYAAMTGR